MTSASDSDLHLLQGIAEATGQADAPLSVVIIQHYGLEHYGSRFFGSRRREWEKVRGRFWEIVLDNTETDAAHIAGQILAARGTHSSEPTPIHNEGSSAPRFLHDAAFMSAARRCAPLHPMTLVLLSRLARLLGHRTERSLAG